MSVLGLPKTVESILTTIIADHALISWKVTGEGDKPVVVLRFNSADQQDGEPTLPVGAWRRKPPSQIRRDKKRAEDRRATSRTDETRTENIVTQCSTESNKRQEQENKASDNIVDSRHTSPCGLFLATPEFMPPSQHDSTHSCVDTPRSARETDPPPATYTRRSGEEHVNNRDDTMCLGASGWQTKDCSLDSAVNQTDDNSESLEHMEKITSERGIDIRHIKLLASELRDRRKQRLLRDRRRNKSFDTVVFEEHIGTQSLYCKSDDVVLMYDFNTDRKRWFFDQSDNMTKIQKHAMSCLRTLPPISKDRYAELYKEELEEDLRIVSRVVRFYLG
ncbi:uncharacterized protein [Littorina saxatilis]|uniref:uncharacterized protein n=1 Tax=Littorina saxatilis TaxID=31220 RepID=UPI0038B55267